MLNKRNKPAVEKTGLLTDPANAQPNKCEVTGNCEVTGSIQIRGQVETTVPPELEAKRDAAEQKRESLEERRYLIERLAFVLLMVYVALTAWQAKSLQGQLNLTERNLRVDQRPWVNVTLPDAVPASAPSIPALV